MLAQIKQNQEAPPPKLDRFLPISKVMDATGLSRVSIWRRVKAGKFPKQVHLGVNCVRWRESEIIAWQQQQV